MEAEKILNSLKKLQREQLSIFFFFYCSTKTKELENSAFQPINLHMCHYTGEPVATRKRCHWLITAQKGSGPLGPKKSRTVIMSGVEKLLNPVSQSFRRPAMRARDEV